ncbi:unnamed protein product [Caenorhabditis bovis]|uniref:Uncharacterized protein n=1 Tax=Caenorhabditis bovis TaxID=2654633 RepID=A0A8S1EU34_9PELO|nr:unnamed protein product [Caenorhabditis bovis]
MEVLIENRDFDGLKEYIKKEKKSSKDEELITSIVDELMRKRGLKVAQQPAATIEDFTRRHFHFSLQLMKAGFCSKMLPITTLQDILESSTIEKCKLLFTIVEEHMPDFKQPPLIDSAQNSILRCCNDLLRRLSRTAETSFCGRIMFFLSRYLPLSEKSGLNLMGHFNVQNITMYDQTESEMESLMAGTTAEAEPSEDMEVGEIDDDGVKEIQITPEMYRQFWNLQKFFSNPPSIFEKDKFSHFKQDLSMVLNLIATNKLEKPSQEDEGLEKNTKSKSDELFFPKYLTSPKLLPLQLNDSQLRRHFLLQCLFVFQYLVSDVKFKTQPKKLTEEQTKFINSTEEKCFKLLAETMPKGSLFTSICKKILHREAEWSAWKNLNCPDFTEKADKAPMQLYRKRARTEFDPSSLDLGTPELTKLWTNEPNILEACKSLERMFFPNIVDFIRDPLDEMDPEQQVEEQYKSVNSPMFQWRCARLLMTESPQYIAKLEKTQEATSNIKEYLEKTIYNTAKTHPEFKEEISVREKREAEARKKVEESLKRKLEASATSSPNSYTENALTDEHFENLAKALAKHAKQLAVVLNVDEKESEKQLRHSGKKMPSFFLKGKKKATPNKDNRKRKNVKNTQNEEIVAKMSRRQKLMANTELHSDDEDSLMGSPQASGGESDVEYEDAHERNFREAKKLLEKIQTVAKDDEEVEEKLKEDAIMRTGTQMRQIADSVSLSDDDEFTYKAHRLSPLCVAFSPDSRYIVSAGKESSIVKYDVKEKKIVGVIKRVKKSNEVQKAHYGVIFALAVSQDQKFLASGGYDNVVKIWNFNTLDHIKDLSGHRGAIYSLCFQLKTNNLFSASQDRSVKMWDVDQLGLVDTMYGHQDGVQQISILSKQRVATVGGRDRTARLWKVEDESQLMFTGMPNCTSLDCVSMINEEHFATGSADGSIALWSFWKKRPLFVRKEAHGSANGSGRWIVALTVLPYTDLMASGSNEGELKLWKIGQDFKKITLFFSYSINGFINSLQFSPNGKMIAVASGKEHKDGRWWVMKEARNQVTVLPVHYDNEESNTAEESKEKTGVESGSEDDEVGGSQNRVSAGKNKEKKTKNCATKQPGEMEPNTMLATICGARGLYMKNKTSMEAFCTVTLHGKGSLRSRAATEAIQCEGDCKWDEVCEFKLNEKFNSLTIAVYSKAKLGSGDVIGKCEIDLEQAKSLQSGPNWLRLKKRSNDEKYRGEVQMQFQFSYEKPSMSISSTSLNHLANEGKESGGGLMSKMKRKIKLAKNGHKQAEDTMSMASAWSVASTKSTKSQRFFGKIGKTLGIKDKSSTLPVGTFLTPNDNHLDTSNGLYETCNSGGTEGLGSRENSSFNVFDNVNGGYSRPASTVGVALGNSSNPFADATSPQPPPRAITTPTSRHSATLPHGNYTSPAIGKDYFQRAPSVHSNASSGFESSKNQKNIDPGNAQDLLAVIDSLKLELQVKESRMKDMQSYMDNLISKVMERNPELLAAHSREKPKIRFF